MNRLDREGALRTRLGSGLRRDIAKASLVPVKHWVT